MSRPVAYSPPQLPAKPEPPIKLQGACTEMEYQHGGDIYSREIELDYSANINPLGLPPGVRRALAQCVEGPAFSLYPDSACRALRQALERHHKIPAEYIICGNGAADLIFGLAAALRPGRGLVLSPTFTEYEQAMRAAGARVDHLLLDEKKGFVPDIEAICGLIRKGKEKGEPYDMAFICNPNNPTGVPLKKEEVEELAGECQTAGVLLVVDECFCDFMEEREACSVIPALERFKNLFVLKAFTKLYAMAGLRLGYGLSSDVTLLEALTRVRQPWSVSGPAQKAGEAALKEEAYVKAARALIGRERQWLKAQLEDMGFRVYDSRANYLFFRHLPESGTGKRTAGKAAVPGGWLYHRLLEQKILIRSCGNYPGLDSSYYRICVRTRAENEVLADRIRKVMEEEQDAGTGCSVPNTH